MKRISAAVLLLVALSCQAGTIESPSELGQEEPVKEAGLITISAPAPMMAGDKLPITLTFDKGFNPDRISAAVTRRIDASNIVTLLVEQVVVDDGTTPGSITPTLDCNISAGDVQVYVEALSDTTQSISNEVTVNVKNDRRVVGIAVKHDHGNGLMNFLRRTPSMDIRVWAMLEDCDHPQSVTTNAIFRSLDAKIAQVSADGEVTPVGDGDTAIVVLYGDLELMVDVKVKGVYKEEGT